MIVRHFSSHFIPHFFYLHFFLKEFCSTSFLKIVSLSLPFIVRAAALTQGYMPVGLMGNGTLCFILAEGYQHSQKIVQIEAHLACGIVEGTELKASHT